MKKINIIKGLTVAVLAGGMASCSENYLTLEPQTEIKNAEAVGSPEAKKNAVYGMCQSMYQQYSSLYSYRWFNGEPWLSMFYGEVVGQDYFSYFWTRSDQNVPNWTRMTNQTATATYVAWSYCYGLISQANNICDATPVDQIEDEETAFRIAQAKTLRAHAYTRLLQIYGPRWADSENGTVKTVVLRKSAADPNGDVNAPLAPMKDVLDFIYKDLDEAIALYEDSGKFRSYEWEPDIEIAQGLYARAALLKDDWQTAQAMANAAREYYPIMSPSEYASGFAEPNGEWMWTNSPAPAGMYFASFGASYACNGAYPCRWQSIGAGAINYDLYRQMDPNDMRCDLFFTPDKVSDPANEALFWDSRYCTSSSMDINKWSNNGGNVKPGPLAYDLYVMGAQIYNRVGAAKGWPYPYSNPAYGGYLPYGTLAPFGAQFKFWSQDYYGSSAFPFMRGAEMLLIEAEAACHNSDYTTAQNCLYELNRNRISGYQKSTKTGDALLEEVKLNRRIELWGEGFNWFDYKRWNEPIVRNSWRANDPTSNNIPASQAGVYDVTKARGWRWTIPRNETQYNDYISESETLN